VLGDGSTSGLVERLRLEDVQISPMSTKNEIILL
jgi:hypothetical protein